MCIRDRQQPVDFAVWQATDGTWQLWSCIRATAYPGATRLFYRWEGSRLTDGNWKPMGIAMTSDTRLGEMEGYLPVSYTHLDVYKRQVMGRGIIDWVGQFKALKRDGYHFAVSLETHWRGAGTPEESTRQSWAGMKKALQEAGAI